MMKQSSSTLNILKVHACRRSPCSPVPTFLKYMGALALSAGPTGMHSMTACPRMEPRCMAVSMKTTSWPAAMYIWMRHFWKLRTSVHTASSTCTPGSALCRFSPSQCMMYSFYVSALQY